MSYAGPEGRASRPQEKESTIPGRLGNVNLPARAPGVAVEPWPSRTRRRDRRIGLAAGLDKDAAAPDGFLKAGFGFVEVGTITPRAQAGNPKPRLFRLVEDRALINRLGFNNGGLDAARDRSASLFNVVIA